MDLLTYLRSLELAQLETFAVDVGTTVGHLRNVAYGNRLASAALAMQIEITSEGKVTRQTLRPTDWQLIWPDAGVHRLVDGQIVTHPGGAKPCSACGGWEMAPEGEGGAKAAPAPDAPAADPVAVPPAAAMLHGGRREEDHPDSGFGGLDEQAALDAVGRLTGAVPHRAGD